MKETLKTKKRKKKSSSIVGPTPREQGHKNSSHSTHLDEYVAKHGRVNSIGYGNIGSNGIGHTTVGGMDLVTQEPEPHYATI